MVGFALPAKLLSAVSCVSANLHSASSEARSAEVLLQGSVWLARTLQPFSMAARRKLLQRVLMCLAYQPGAAVPGFQPGSQSSFLSTCRGFVVAYMQTYLSQGVGKELPFPQASSKMPASDGHVKGGPLRRPVGEIVVADLQAQGFSDGAKLEMSEPREGSSGGDPQAVVFSSHGQQETIPQQPQPQPSSSSAAEQESLKGMTPNQNQPERYSSSELQDVASMQRGYQDNPDRDTAQSSPRTEENPCLIGGASMPKPVQRCGIITSKVFATCYCNQS